jgi:hypothetical protein
MYKNLPIPQSDKEDAILAYSKSLNPIPLMNRIAVPVANVNEAVVQVVLEEQEQAAIALPNEIQAGIDEWENQVQNIIAPPQPPQVEAGGATGATDVVVEATGATDVVVGQQGVEVQHADDMPELVEDSDEEEAVPLLVQPDEGEGEEGAVNDFEEQMEVLNNRIAEVERRRDEAIAQERERARILIEDNLQQEAIELDQHHHSIVEEEAERASRRSAAIHSRIRSEAGAAFSQVVAGIEAHNEYLAEEQAREANEEASVRERVFAILEEMPEPVEEETDYRRRRSPTPPPSNLGTGFRRAAERRQEQRRRTPAWYPVSRRLPPFVMKSN